MGVKFHVIYCTIAHELSLRWLFVIAE